MNANKRMLTGSRKGVRAPGDAGVCDAVALDMEKTSLASACLKLRGWVPDGSSARLASASGHPKMSEFFKRGEITLYCILMVFH
jgi:hypothetical protein